MAAAHLPKRAGSAPRGTGPMGPAPRGAGDSIAAALPAHRMGRRGRRTVAAVSEHSHRHLVSGTCARLARTVLTSIDRLKSICRRARSTSRRRPVHTRHTRTQSSGQSDLRGSYLSIPLRTHAAGMFMRHGWSGRARLSAGTHGHALSEASPGLEVEALKGCWAAHAHTGLVLWRSITGRPLGRGW